jgi:hypothetical protein
MYAGTALARLEVNHQLPSALFLSKPLKFAFFKIEIVWHGSQGEGRGAV